MRVQTHVKTRPSKSNPMAARVAGLDGVTNGVSAALRLILKGGKNGIEKDLDKLLGNLNAKLPQDVYDYILKTYSTEPDDSHEWSAQNIFEQIRKIVIENTK